MTRTTSKREALRILEAVKCAIKTGDYSLLDPASREICIRIFKKKRWEMPEALWSPGDGHSLHPYQKKELILWDAVELCLNSPRIRNKNKRERYEQAFAHVLAYFKKGFLIRDLWIPEIQRYIAHRVTQGAAASTIDKERQALSAMFRTLIEHRLVVENPVRMAPAPSQKDGLRAVYISWDHFNQILGHLPEWARPIVQTLYYTGMRRGEVFGMTWDNVDLKNRIIRLRPNQTKEKKEKLVPIHTALVEILDHVRSGKLRSISSNLVFLSLRGKSLHRDALKNPWRRAVKAVGLKPLPTIHDLRHVWKTNAAESGMDFEIREAIMGHGAGAGIAARYGRLRGPLLVKAIDQMKFDHGETDIWLARQK